MRVRLREGLRYFVSSEHGRVIRYDPRNGAVSEGVLPDWLELSIPVQVGQDIFAFYEGEWSKYTLIQTDGWIRSQKARSSVQREWPALTFVAAAQAIYLTGGVSYRTLTSCERYCIRTDQWFPAPDLNVARYDHSSCAQGRFLFVFCGYNNTGPLNSIEQLDTEADTNGSATQWNLISVSPDVFPGRWWPLVVPINATEILIMGG